MDHVARTLLVATAIGEVIECMKSSIDLEIEREEGRVFMEAATKFLGLPANTGREDFDDWFREFKRNMFVTLEKRAKNEFAAAVSEAEVEQRIYSHRLDSLQKLHTETMQLLAEQQQKILSENNDLDFVNLTISAHEQRVVATERFHHEFMKMFKEKHRLELEYCFRRHMVGKETTKKLVELYEVK